MKLFPKLFWSFLSIFLIFAIAILIFTYGNVNRNYLDTSLHYLTEYHKLIEPMILDHYKSEDMESLDHYSKTLDAGIRITFIDLDGKVLADSDKDIRFLGNHKTRPEVISAGDSGSGFSWRYSSSVRHKMLYYAEKLSVNDVPVGYLRISFYDYQIDNLQENLLNDLTLLVLIGILLSLVITYVLSRNFIKPIQKLALATKKVADGDFSIRIVPESYDEIYSLSASFNTMTSKVQKLIEEINMQTQALRNIIDNINELLWAIDAKTEKITIANHAFDSFLETDNPAGKYYWQVIRHLKINETIKQVLNDKKSTQQEINLFNHDFSLSVNYLEESGLIIFLMHDITPLRKLEKVKKDFVTNASHELRTPIASIKGYSELLRESISDDNRSILNIIERNVSRLSFLVNDILSLASLENISKVDLEKTNVSQLLDNCCLLFKPKLAEKEIVIEKHYKEKVYADVDPFRFEQVINNLIDNAIKYTQAGKITLSAHIEGARLIFECCDTGIGISEEDQERLFERFFVTDKSRSRKSGGTGLGLSIVKHIINLHKGEISVNSKLGFGSCFHISIPRGE